MILFVGVNGAGKTTSVAKIAHRLVAEGNKVLLAACDTFRAGAIAQLETWAARAGVEIVRHQDGSDAAAVAFDAYAAAVARGHDVLLIDTAGRLHTKDNLMEELRKLVRVLRKHDPALPHETLLVIDGNTGQNALPQFRGFGAAADLTGLVITKLDGTAKGGAVLSLSREFDAPIRWVGVGEGLDDLLPFDREAFARSLFSPGEAVWERRDPIVSFPDRAVTFKGPVANPGDSLLAIDWNIMERVRGFWRVGVAFPVLGALLGCQASRYEPDAKFVDLYADLKLVSMALNHDLERAGEMRRVVLARHGMTSAKFHEHFMRLAGHPEAWRPFQERVLARVDAFQKNREDVKNGR